MTNRVAMKSLPIFVIVVSSVAYQLTQRGDSLQRPVSLEAAHRMPGRGIPSADGGLLKHKGKQ